MRVCYTCKEGTREGSLIGIWMMKIRAFWATHPRLLTLYEASFPLLLVTTVAMAIHPDTRDFAAIPFSLMAILYLTGEHTPVSPFPHSTLNALSTPKYIGLMRVVTNCILLVLFYGLMVELIAPTSQEEFVKRIINVSIFTVPITGLMFLSVGSRPTLVAPTPTVAAV